MKTEKVAVTTNNKTNGGSNMKGFFGGMKKWVSCMMIAARAAFV